MSLRGLAIQVATTLAISVFACAATIVAADSDTLHVTYGVSLVGLPIGVAHVTADITPSSYSVDLRARMSGLASLVSNARGASTGKGAIVGGHVVPATFATTASSSKMTRTIRMALADNVVTGVEIAPPFDDNPDRIPLTDKDKHGVLDPVGAFVIPMPTDSGPTSPAACNRTIPIFDGWTRFDIKLSYVGQREVSAKGYSGPVAICAARYVPIAGHRPDKPTTKYMAENKDMEVWLAPVAGANVLLPFRVSVRTMIGMAVAEATEFSVAAK
jgi:hypothetical protein